MGRTIKIYGAVIPGRSHHNTKKHKVAKHHAKKAKKSGVTQTFAQAMKSAGLME